MRNIEQIGDQWLVTVDIYTVILLCDNEYWYLMTECELGETWCGNTVQLFDTETQAEQYITDNNLTLWVDPE